MKNASNVILQEGEMDSCPSETMLHIKLRSSMRHGARYLSFQCLGHWEGDNGLMYVSLLDTQLSQLGEIPRPRYRCGVYHTNIHTGITNLVLTNDSTCDYHNYGEEVFVLQRQRTPHNHMDEPDSYDLPDKTETHS